MVNMNVEWAGPNSSLVTLAKELNARFGAPSRPYEYVTGYKSPYNVSGHNADANGRGHSMDIFVGAGQNISVAAGIDLAERLRSEGKKGNIPGHPDRLAYIIHRGRIAGDHTNWEWVAYNGIADHYDHIHISSVFDYYWGDPVAGSPLDYNSTAAWNLWATSTQGGGTQIITKGPEVKYTRLYPKPERRRLSAKAGAWFLKDNSGRINQNYATLGVGLYDIDLFIQGDGLPEGETIEVQFYVVTKGKYSGYFAQKVHGTKDGKFKGNARFKLPVKGSTVEASVLSSCETGHLTIYGADVTLATV